MKHELLLAAIIFLLLILKIAKPFANEGLLKLVQVLLIINFAAGFFMQNEGSLFSSMFFRTPLTIIEKNVLNLGILLCSFVFSDWLVKHKHLSEFFVLMLSSVLGLFLLVSSGNLLMFYLSLELASLPVAALANFDLDKRKSSEGATKLILTSTFASGLFLFGSSLLYGSLGSLQFSVISERLSQFTPLDVTAFVLMFVALAFKLSIVPFHLWTADVYEGSPAPVSGYLSVISKGGVAFAFINFVAGIFNHLQPVWTNMFFTLAIVTAVVGNIFALRQNNIKRFLAFSSIAQMGFVLFAINGYSRQSVAAVIYFILVYIFSNLAAFGAVSAISSRVDKEGIKDYNGLYKTNPMVSWVLAIALFSLAGVPPTAGFFGKLFLITAGSMDAPIWIVVVLALNLVISLFYYLKVVRAIFIEKNENPIPAMKLRTDEQIGFWLCLAGIILVGIFGFVFEYIKASF